MTLCAKVFWLKDKFLGGGEIKKAYDQVSNGFKTGEENIYQREALVRWATQEVPYYKQYINYKFEELPIVNKSITRWLN